MVRTGKAKEHVGGFWILEAADMEEALGWARKCAAAGPMMGEVREIPYSSLPNGTPHPSRVKKVGTRPAKPERGDS